MTADPKQRKAQLNFEQGFQYYQFVVHFLFDVLLKLETAQKKCNGGPSHGKDFNFNAVDLNARLNENKY